MQTSKRAIILSGGRLDIWALAHIRPDDLVIAADGGAWFAVQQGIRPHMSIGDFDSISPEQFKKIQENSIEVNACDPVWKDLTDTEMALEYALASEAREIVMLGVTGTRMDHTLANIHLLAKAEARGIPAAIIDANNEIRLVNDRLTVVRSDYKYISLIPLTEKASGITLNGFRYPLQDAELTLGETRGISNELASNSGTITLKSGKLLVIQSKD